MRKKIAHLVTAVLFFLGLSLLIGSVVGQAAIFCLGILVGVVGSRVISSILK